LTTLDQYPNAPSASFERKPKVGILVQADSCLGPDELTTLCEESRVERLVAKIKPNSLQSSDLKPAFGREM